MPRDWVVSDPDAEHLGLLLNHLLELFGNERNVGELIVEIVERMREESKGGD